MKTETESVPETLSISSIDWVLENIQPNICVINQSLSQTLVNECVILVRDAK
jgi:hypothetical protein